MVALTSQGPDSPPAMVEVSGLSVGFGPLQALADVDLRIGRGELVGLTGENGAGKSTLMRCLAGDLVPSRGRVLVAGEPGPQGDSTRVGVVWQDLALCDDLDVAANLLLGRERRGLLETAARTHTRARRLLADLGIPISRTTDRVGDLSGAQRQLLAIAHAVSTGPDLLLLDEPTTNLGVADTELLEGLIGRLHARGTTILLVSHDVEQLIRVTQRIVVLRRGRLVGEVESARAHRDDVVALLSGHELLSSAHDQLHRLHALTDSLASADPSSSLLMILTALGTALDADRLCMHVAVGPDRLRLACALGVPGELQKAWRELPFGTAGGPAGAAAESEIAAVDTDVRTGSAWRPFVHLAWAEEVASSWSVPFTGSDGLAGVITVLGDEVGRPTRDELDLVTLYGGYAASAIERDRLVGELTSRNLVLETIRDVLESLAGPVPVADSLETALRSLLRGVLADEAALFTPGPDGAASCRVRVHAGEHGRWPGMEAAVAEHRAQTAADGHAEPLDGAAPGWGLAVSFLTRDGMVTLAARRELGGVTDEASALLEDAANSVRLALEREQAQAAAQQTAALRRSQQLQREFLARLSHELRTPLTAIGGYAETLMQGDVTWDKESHDRFLSRIGAESTRLRRLVEDLLDHSAIESGVLKLQRDWCDLPLLLDAARSCLAPASQACVQVQVVGDVPAIWADHDRLEQVFLNLLDNAVRHNARGTQVWAEVRAGEADTVRVVVRDNGAGTPDAVLASPFAPHHGTRGPTAGAGLGLSIAHAIVVTHGGEIEMHTTRQGTSFEIDLPVGNDLADSADREVPAHG